MFSLLILLTNVLSPIWKTGTEDCES